MTSPGRSGEGHTPGPWSFRAGDSVVFIRGADGEAIAATDSKRYYQRHDETDLANARLISAAPDLLDALMALDERGHTQAVWSLAKRAIAKATGKATP